MERVDNTLADLLPDILCRLPVKSLMRFKCVEKSWCRLVEDPKFLIKHLLFFNANTCLESFDLIVKSSRSAKSSVSLLSQKQSNVSLDLLDLPYNKYMFAHLHVLGPCKGIYYLRGFPSSLINPAMREFKALPETHIPPPPGTQFILNVPGFGFDPNADDYKVVLLRLPSERTQESTWFAEVYSLKTNNWRQVECPIPFSVGIQVSELNTFVNGAYHWWGSDADESSVIAFDMVDEMFRRMKFPIMSDTTPKTADVSVATFKDSLAVMLYPPNDTNKYFDLWLLRDYSDDSSWEKLFRVQPTIEIERPIGFLRNSDKMILETRKGIVALFDVKTNKITELGINGGRKSFQALVYEESLVSLRRESQKHQAAAVTVFNVVAENHLLRTSQG